MRIKKTKLVVPKPDEEMSIPDRGEGNVREVLGPDAWTVELE